MSGAVNAPVIIKRKKVVAGGGHHGGAWKVAYADFVTAMMAFFMLMWLQNATTEKQRKGIADYFSPTIPVNRISGGGDGALGGDSVFTEETLAQNGVGASSLHAAQAEGGRTGLRDGDPENQTAMLERVESRLLGIGGDVLDPETELRHLATRVTDEGLVVELFSIEGSPLFDEGTGAPTPLLERLVSLVAMVFAESPNPVAIEGHSRAHAVVLASNPTWDRSLDRAARARDLVEEILPARRIARVVGHADRQPAVEDPMAVRNDRLELILLRTGR